MLGSAMRIGMLDRLRSRQRIRAGQFDAKRGNSMISGGNMARGDGGVAATMLPALPPSRSKARSLLTSWADSRLDTLRVHHRLLVDCHGSRSD